MKVVVAGSTGLLGSALGEALRDRGHTVLPLVRPETRGMKEGIAWDPTSGLLDPAALEGCDAVVNLAGRSIGAMRWSADEKEALRSSRTKPTRLLAETIAGLDRPPRVLLNASAVGFYGDRGDERLTEDAEPGEGFFPDLCVAWEAAAAPAADAGVRVVRLRSGVVLTEGGALGRLLAPFGPAWLSPYRWGLGGWIGSGRQYWSWISLRDEVASMTYLLDSDLSGPVNLVSPEPVTNKAFMKAVGRALHRPVVVPIPAFVVKAILGSELAGATLLDGQAVVPERLLSDGFEFTDTDLDAVLSRILGR
jgi:uncharacterized protein (TIGR01777 family)